MNGTPLAYEQSMREYHVHAIHNFKTTKPNQLPKRLPFHNENTHWKNSQIHLLNSILTLRVAK